MIVPMKPVAILMPETRLKDAVRRIGELGVVHLRDWTEPADEADLKLINSAIGQLEPLKTEGMTPSRARDEEPTNIANLVLKLAAEQDQISSLINDLEMELERIAPLGDFDPKEVDEFQQHGLNLRVFRCTEREFLKLDKSTASSLINRENGMVWIAVMTRFGDQPPGLPEIRLPSESASKIREHLEGAKRNQSKNHQQLLDLIGCLDQLRGEAERLRERREYRAALNSARLESPLAWLEGYCPEPRLADLRELAETEGLAVLEREIETGDSPPTLLANPTWVDSVNPIYRMINSIPGYREADVSLWFLIYLTLFFAILIGDAGYGLLVLAGAEIGRRYLKLAKPAFRLIVLLGGATLIWGALTGNWFGIKALSEVPVLRWLVIPKLNAFVPANQDLVMLICFIIGSTHLSVAHLVIAFRQRRSLKALCQVGWTLVVWGSFFVVRFLVLETPLPGFTYMLLIAGALLAVCFAEPQRNLLKAFGIGLARLPLKLMNCFADLISYIRLFAVGMATLAVAASFNEIAAGIGFGNPGRVLLASLVLVLGHGINLLMAALSVVVHGIRLNMLEFSGHAELEWAGGPYAPFHLTVSENHQPTN